MLNENTFIESAVRKAASVVGEGENINAKNLSPVPAPSFTSLEKAL